MDFVTITDHDTIASAPAIVSWSVIVTKSMPRRLARA